MNWTPDTAQAWWGRGQGLTGPRGADLADTVHRTGWIRTLAGAEAYLALAARCTGVTVSAVHQAVAARTLQVSPSVRGCIYLVPADDAAISLRIAEQLSRRRNARDLEKVGASSEELVTVGEAVLALLRSGPLSTRALGKALPDGVVRSLGEVGKKVGLSTTLPSALRQLEFAGRIVRHSVEDRLDHDRYDWLIPDTDPLANAPETDAEVHIALARRFARWAGPATRDEFAAWSGLGKRDAASALEAAELVQVQVQGLGAGYVVPELLEAALPAPDRTAFLPAMDNLIALRGSSAAVVDPAGHDVEIPVFGSGGPKPLAQINVPLARVLARGGRVVGLWEWEASEGAVVTRSFVGSDLDRSAADEAAAILTELGHAKVTGIDSEAAQARRLACVRDDQ